jgi:flagellum-specific ATP synthase
MMDFKSHLEHIIPAEIEGSVTQSLGITMIANGFPVPVGSLAEIKIPHGGSVLAEVIGFRNESTILFPLGRREGVRPGCRVRLARTLRWLRVGDGLLGRVVDAQGRVIDGKSQPLLRHRVLFDQPPPHPCDRPRIQEPLPTGVKAIDGLLTCGRGQRLGIFAAAGVGKSVLLGMMARYTAADVIVIGLIGERGREVNDFIERDLGPEGLKKSVVVVATSSEPAILRVQAAYAASAIAEYFRDQGKDVLLLMDSLTRFALAQREIGLAAGEPPTTRGYPPSVFALLPRLVERAGRTPHGSITAFYTVLVEGNDPDEPVADAVRGLLDGHIWLSRNLANRGHYPAIDVLESLSRLMPDIVDPQHYQAALQIRDIMGVYREHEDLITIGAYRRGSHPKVDVSIQLRDAINTFLKQNVEQQAEFKSSREMVIKLGEQIQDALRTATAPQAGKDVTTRHAATGPAAVRS